MMQSCRQLKVQPVNMLELEIQAFFQLLWYDTINLLKDNAFILFQMGIIEIIETILEIELVSTKWQRKL